MTADLVLRFVLGGAFVSMFSAIGEMAEPKRFAGIFGVAPSIALVTLGIAYIREGGAAVAYRGRWFVLGCIAMFAYCQVSVALCRRPRPSMGLVALVALVAWLGTAALLYFAL